jgi:hypothetical protein
MTRIDTRSNLTWLPSLQFQDLPIQRKNKLAQGLLNHKVQTIQSGDGNVITDPDPEEMLEDLKYRLVVSNSVFVFLFISNDNPQGIKFTPNQ